MRSLARTLPLLLVLGIAACTTTRPPASAPPPPLVQAPPAVVPTPVELVFYDTPVAVQCGQLAGDSLALPLAQPAVDAFLGRLQQAGADACLASLRSTHEALQLNDWGYFLLVRDLGARLFPARDNEATLFAWYAMRQSGYRARFSYSPERSFLLLASDQHVATLRQSWADGQRYYFALPRELPSEFTPGTPYPPADTTATRLVDFQLRAAPHLATTLVPRELTFRYQKERFTIPSRYNEGLIRFLEDYPRGNLALYLDASLSRELEEDLVAGLGPLLAGKTEVEALNLLLAFVQHGFRYKEDLQHFGHERYLLPDEMFFYPFSDCEDRAILFSYLVRRFLDLEVIGLRYPNHVATAVRIHSEVAGEHVTYAGERYVVADPTFFGSGVGAVVPQVAGHTPELIVPKPVETARAQALSFE